MTGTISAVLSETLLMTALLIGLVLLVRRSVTHFFGPRLGYALWLIPALRLMLPPLPGKEVVLDASAPGAMLEMPVDAATTASASMATDPVGPMLMEELLTALPLIWLVGVVIVLGLVLIRHRRWHRALMDQATPLDPVDGIRLVMSAAVSGPIATGLLRPVIAVPTDFFTRYNRNERRLAIEHELAHHRSGDMWANAAALLVLAAQWFNPLAWLALRAFRFDQEAACDARVLAGLSGAERGRKAHSYACAIAKSLTGPRLVLAAPMTSGNKVKERLQMLSHDPKIGPRPMMGRAVLGGAIVSALALTISSLPARIVYAAEPGAAPDVSEAPPPPGTEPKRERQILIIDANADGAVDGEKAGPAKPGESRIIIHSTKDGEGGAVGGKPRVMMFSGKAGERAEMDLEAGHAMPFPGVTMFAPNNDELRATLKEQGIDNAKADAIIKKMEEKRKKSMRYSFNSADVAQVQSFAATLAVAGEKCRDGEKPRIMVDRSGEGAGGNVKVRMVSCSSVAAFAANKQVEAMKRARDRLAAEKDDGGMGAEIRASIIADINKTISELEAKKD